jgi:hypothetical protein
MKLTLSRLGRFWQYIGVAVAAHVATRHAAIWGHPEIATEAGVASSWTRVFIGVALAVVLFWTGVYLEGRSTKKNEAAE